MTLKRVLFITTIILIASAAFLIVGIDGFRFLTRKFDGKRPKATQSREQIMLDRVIFLDRSKTAQVSEETGEILYSGHQSEFLLTFKIPADGVLDTAVGIDPLIKNLFAGDIRFTLSVILNNSRPQTVFQKDVVLSKLSEKEFVWQKVEIDLSEYSGREVIFKFGKSYDTDSGKKPKAVYDLIPTDFMYWRTPSVRTKKLKDKYNVILISLDTLRADHLHFMGYPRETSPNLDMLARNGTFFTAAISQAPWTTPSHFSIFTSAYPAVHKGNQTIHARDRSWDGKLPTMAGILRDKGYVTAAFTGKGSISAKFGFYRGFDFYNETSSFSGEGFTGEHIGDAETVFDKSMRWLDDNEDRSFFLFIHTYEPHAPYDDDFFVKREKIAESETIKHTTALYDGDIRRADFFVGKLTEKLDELRLADNTIVVITSDHGEDLGGRYSPEVEPKHGHSLYDEMLRVPLIFYSPKIFPREKRIDYQVRLIDILPTVLEYLGYEGDNGFQGMSLKGMIEGNDRTSRPAYSEATTYGTERESMRDGGYKYIHRISYGQLSRPDSRGLPLTPLHELYDVDADPGEKENLAEKQKDMVEKYQKSIVSLFPEKNFDDDESAPPAGGIDIGKDRDLMRELKSLGYVQ